MTADEIKRAYSMTEIIERYGHKINRSRMMRCPFHQDHDASMKVYASSYHCFGCGADGDIFSFVQHELQCDFKQAFYELGGTYSNDHRDQAIARYNAQKAKETAETRRRIQKEKEAEQFKRLHEAHDELAAAEQDSDAMWDAVEKSADAWLRLQNMEGSD